MFCYFFVCLRFFCFFFFFFFQAEDGIRDGRVTGVQTCALPIWSDPSRLMRIDVVGRNGATELFVRDETRPPAKEGLTTEQRWRSEERRVGKECRSRWWPDH